MSARRRRRPPKATAGSRPQPRPAAETELPHRNLTPTILWGAGALVALAVLVGLVLVPFTVGLAPGSRLAFIGSLLLVGVVTLGLGAKAAEAYLDWRE